jgi:DNA-binding phage protein
MAERTRLELDVLTLAIAVQTIARHRRISMSEVARETGLSASTLTRMGNGQKPDADGLVTILTWLGISTGLSEFVRDREPASDG